MQMTPPILALEAILAAIIFSYGHMTTRFPSMSDRISSPS